MRASFGLPSIEGDTSVESRPPISVRFEIPYFTVSGLQVSLLAKWQSNYLCVVSSVIIPAFVGSLPEDCREEWLSRIALGALHNAEWGLPIKDGLSQNKRTYLPWLCLKGLSSCNVASVLRTCFPPKLSSFLMAPTIPTPLLSSSFHTIYTSICLSCLLMNGLFIDMKCTVVNAKRSDFYRFLALNCVRIYLRTSIT